VLRSWGNFRLLSYLTVADAVAAFGLAIYGGYRWGFLGAMLGMLAAWLIDLIILHVYSGIRIRPSWNLATAVRLFKTGLLILAITFSDTLLKTVDGAIIIRYYDAYRIGLYSVGMQMAGYMFTLPEAAGFVIWPKIIEAWGASGDLRRMRRHVQLPTQISAAFMPLLAGSAHILLPLLIVWIVPEFVNSAKAGQILAWGGIFLALPLASNSVLIATNRELVVTATRGLSGVALGVVSYLLVQQQAPIEHIALTAAGAYAVASVLSLMWVLPQYFKGYQLMVEIAGCYLPTVWAMVSLKIANVLASDFIMPHPADPMWAVLYLLFFVCLYVPGMVYGKYHTGLWQELTLLWQQRKARNTNRVK
jgi:O-antigen/teichoic acid export membrane protein